MNPRIRRELEKIEAVCNRFPEGTIVMIQDSPNDVYFLPDAQTLSKEEILIIRRSYDCFWAYICDNDKATTYKCNRINQMIVKGYDVTIEENHWENDYFISNHTTHETIALQRGSVKVVTDDFGKAYLVPASAISIHDYRNDDWVPYERRYGAEHMIINNLNDEVIRESGKIKIGPDGIKFSPFYSERETVIASTEDLMQIFGNPVLNELWAYANEPGSNPVERLVKAKILEIVTGGHD